MIKKNILVYNITFPVECSDKVTEKSVEQLQKIIDDHIKDSENLSIQSDKERLVSLTAMYLNSMLEILKDINQIDEILQDKVVT